MTGQLSRAVVCDGPLETGYRRIGAGRAVVLLGLAAGDDDESLTAWARAVPGLRLIAPDAPPSAPGRDLAGWLSGFVQGLGLVRPHIVADAGWAPHLRALEDAGLDELGEVRLLEFEGAGAEGVPDVLASLS